MLAVVLAAAFAACGPPLNKSSDGGAGGGGDAGASDGDAQSSTTCADPTTCCAAPASGCDPPFTTGTMTASIGSGGLKFSSDLVGTRRVGGGTMLEIVGKQGSDVIKIVVPASVGTFQCTEATGAWVYYHAFVGTTATASTGRGTGTVIVSAVDDRVTGVFSVDDAFTDLADGTFSVTLSK